MKVENGVVFRVDHFAKYGTWNICIKNKMIHP
jgi:hypothetical protein